MDQHHVMNEIRELQYRLNVLKTSIYRELKVETLPTGEKDLLFLQIAADQFGILLDSCEEVLKICALTPIPESPSWIAGLLNLRAEMIPVIDVTSRITRKPRKFLLDDLIVITSHEGNKFGLIVQGINKISRIKMETVHDVSADVPQAPYVLGVYEQAPKSVFLLSIAALISTSDFPEEKL